MGNLQPRRRGAHAILHGTGGREIEFAYDDGLRTYKAKKSFEGVIGNLERRWRETDSAWMREEIERYMPSSRSDDITLPGTTW